MDQPVTSCVSDSLASSLAWLVMGVAVVTVVIRCSTGYAALQRQVAQLDATLRKLLEEQQQHLEAARREWREKEQRLHFDEMNVTERWTTRDRRGKVLREQDDHFQARWKKRN